MLAKTGEDLEKDGRTCKCGEHLSTGEPRLVYRISLRRWLLRTDNEQIYY
jgi:hypothetical protein